MPWNRLIPAVLFAVFFGQALLAPTSALAARIDGRVQLGEKERAEPQARVWVTLYEATDGEPIVLARARTDRDGRFRLHTNHEETNSIFFLTAHVNLGVKFVAILGTELPEQVTINEMTSVAASYSMAQFYRSGDISGDAFALRIAALMSGNIADIATGESSPVLLAAPNADQTESLRMTRSLSNLLNAAAKNVFIRFLYLLANTPSGGPIPLDTSVATANLARDPGKNVLGLYSLSKTRFAYTPALESPPNAWTVTVKVNDSGDDAFLFGGPANVSFDSRGYAWIANNSVQGTPNSANCIMVLKPDGTPATGGDGLPTSPVFGGGILGVGWGTFVDHTDTVWIGNFGWGGDPYYPTVDPIVSMDPLVLGNGSVSKFTSAGVSQSDPIGFFGKTYRVQALKVDGSGNVWCASFGNDRVVVFPGGDPEQAKKHCFYEGAGTFGIAIAPDGDAWVSNSGGLAGLNQSSVAKVQRLENGDLHPRFTINVGDTLKVIDVDSLGNAWVASQGDNTVYGFDRDGNQLGAFTGGGIYGPWGLCIDGEDNVWIGNFGPLEVGNNFTTGGISKICGANPAGWPRGKTLGDPLSPETRYTVQSAGSEVLLHNGTPLYGTGEGAEPSYAPIMRCTGLQIDRAGNIWAANNWKPRFTTDVGLFNDGTIVVAPDEGNPGGDGLVIYVGIAPPPR